MPFVALIANPIVLLEGKYKPVCVLPVKFNEGAATEPAANVAEVNELDVLVVALYTFVPSQTTKAVWF